uniref:USP domain-containing protein n=1 Tax=Nelumbo nucifera TaxID=4432 RepID=A0A822YIW4_NELNU|nr:TPA_asm: hypothetical protein HUJ06_010080 [Nelumbo nucifera]
MLYAVVVHLDVMNVAFTGHYVCYIKNFWGKWFKIDDSTVCSLFTVKLYPYNMFCIQAACMDSHFLTN